MSKKRGWRETSGFVPKGLRNSRKRNKRNNRLRRELADFNRAYLDETGGEIELEEVQRQELQELKNL